MLPRSYVNCSICRMEPCDYHYNPGGYDIIAKPIAETVRRRRRRARTETRERT